MNHRALFNPAAWKLADSGIASQVNFPSLTKNTPRNGLWMMVLAIWFQLAFSSQAAELEKSALGVASTKTLWSDFMETNFPFFSSTLDARKLGKELPGDNLTPRGLILNLGNDCWSCFDLDLLRMS